MGNSFPTDPECRPPSAKKLMSNKAANDPPHRQHPPGREKAKQSNSMEFVVDEVSKNVAKQLNSSHPAPSSVAQPDWNIITESIVNGSRTMEALVMHQVVSPAPSPRKKRYFEDVMAANAL